MLRAEVLEAILYGCVMWSPCACHYDMLRRRAHHSFLTRCIGERKNNPTDHSIYYLDTLMKTGKESPEVRMRKRRIMCAGAVTRMGHTRLPKCVMFEELAGHASYVAGQKKSKWGVSWIPQSFRYQHRQVNDCSSEGGRMPHYSGTSGGTFHGEIDRWKESQGWTAARRSMPERDETCILRKFCFLADDILSFSGVTSLSLFYFIESTALFIKSFHI